MLELIVLRESVPFMATMKYFICNILRFKLGNVSGPVVCLDVMAPTTNVA